MRFPGSHHTIYACSLPPWLLVRVIQLMVQYFGKILLAELQQFMEAGHARGRMSGDSAGFSSPSSSSDDSDVSMRRENVPSLFEMDDFELN